MANMSYCKYENTLTALRQCAEDWASDYIPSLNKHEASAKEELVKLMRHILTLEGLVVEGAIDDEYTDFLPTRKPVLR